MNTKLTTDAKRTVRIQRDGFYVLDHRRIEIGESQKEARQNTRLWRPEDFPEDLTLGGAFTPEITVTAETTLQAAARLATEGIVPLCLNFASAKNPGGGFLGGAKAQEESLARASGLYTCLLEAPDYYAFHRAQRDPFYSDHMIYSPAVPVFADDHSRLLEAPYRVDFLTSPAPNAGVIAQQCPDKLPLVRPTLLLRARRLLWLAKTSGARHLVLGAWGCGVFRCDPAMVADIFSEALADCAAFERVVFAIYDRSRSSATLRTFQARLDLPA